MELATNPKGKLSTGIACMHRLGHNVTWKSNQEFPDVYYMIFSEYKYLSEISYMKTFGTKDFNPLNESCRSEV